MQVGRLVSSTDAGSSVLDTHRPFFFFLFPIQNASLQVTNFDVSNNCNVENLDQCIALCGDGSFANYECTSQGTVCTCSDECLDYETSKANTQVWAINPVRS